MRLFVISLLAVVYGYAQPNPITLGDITLFDPANGRQVYMSSFVGSDCGAQINAAYAALPAVGGKIIVDTSCSFSTSVNFNTPNKMAILEGYGNSTTLTYTGSGVAFTYNNGPAFDFASALNTLTLTGPGSSTGSTGLLIGGGNGAIGFTASHFKIQSFGVNIQTASNTWLTRFVQGMSRDSTRTLLMPSGQTNAGEEVQFDHVVFADAPAPHTNAVWVQGGGQEVVFTDCSFDQAQLRIGNGGTSSAQVVIKGSHFENPNYALVGSVNYNYLTIDANNGNYVRLSESYMIQDAPSGGPTQYISHNGGKLIIVGFGMFTPAGSPLTHLLTISGNAGLEIYGVDDLSGNISGSLVGGTTTGFCVNFSGANTNNPTPQNFVLKTGDCIGGAALDVTGNVRASNQLVALVSTGTAPMIVNSTTPVTNLFANLNLYQSNGTRITNSIHVTTGTAVLSGGTSTVTLVGGAVFAATMTCTATDSTAANAVRLSVNSGSQFSLVGTGTDTINYVCVGY